MPELHPATQLRDITLQTLDMKCGESEGSDEYDTGDIKFARSTDRASFLVLLHEDTSVLAVERDVVDPVENMVGFVYNIKSGENHPVEVDRINSFAAYLLKRLVD